MDGLVWVTWYEVFALWRRAPPTGLEEEDASNKITLSMYALYIGLLLLLLLLLLMLLPVPLTMV